MQRLSGVTYPQAGTESYTYDAAGNRIEKRVERTAEKTEETPVQGYTATYIERYNYDECNRLTAKSIWENGNEKPTDTTTYTYDAQGSLLTEKSMDICKKYLYNDLHQCIRTEVIRGKEEEAERAVLANIYDGEGLRCSIIENGRRTDFVTNGWENLAELDENGKVTKRILRGNGIVASEDTEGKTYAWQDIADTADVLNTTSHYYHGNERMDVEYITDEAGRVVNSYEYDAFGSITSSTESLKNRYTYNGEVYDKTTEQYYLRKRFYNPKLCRFTQEDEYRGDGLNLYAFCANNPVMYVDPSGYEGVTYTNKPIYIGGKKVGTVSYKTGEYLDIQINKKYLPKNSSTSGINIDASTKGKIYSAFNEKNSLIRGKNVENVIASAVISQYLQIGDGLDGKFPVIDLGNQVEVVSIKSLNEFCKSYLDTNKKVDITTVCDRLMDYYNKTDDIKITVNGKTEIEKTLLAALNGKNSDKLKAEYSEGNE